MSKFELLCPNCNFISINDTKMGFCDFCNGKMDFLREIKDFEYNYDSVKDKFEALRSLGGFYNSK